MLGRKTWRPNTSLMECPNISQGRLWPREWWGFHFLGHQETNYTWTNNTVETHSIVGLTVL